MTHAENWVAQWTVEWGAPIAVAVAAFAFRSLWPRRPRTDRSLAALCGVIALGTQNLVDFGLELAGLAMVAAIAVGTVTAEDGNTKHSTRGTRVSLRSATMRAGVGSCLAVALCIPWFTVWSRSELERALQPSAQQSSSAFAMALDRAISWYPYHPQFIVLAASRAVQTRAPDALRWINLAMQRAPAWAAPHELAGRELELRGRIRQAAIEFGIAAQNEPGAAWFATCAFAQRHPAAEIVFQIAPHDLAGSNPMLDELLSCVDARNQDAITEPLAEAVLKAYPSSERAHQILISIAERRGAVALALDRSGRMLQRLPASPQAFAMRARSLARAGRADQALLLLSAAPLPVARDKALMMARGDAAAHARKRDGIEQASEDLLATYGSSTELRKDLLSLTSVWFDMAGFQIDAMASAQAAYEVSGDPAMLERAHRSAVGAGLLPAALQTAARLCQLRYKVERFCAGGLVKPQ